MLTVVDAAWLISLLTLRWQGPPTRARQARADLATVPPAVRALITARLHGWQDPVCRALFADLVRRGWIEVEGDWVRLGLAREDDRLAPYERVVVDVVARLQESRHGVAPSAEAVQRSTANAIRRPAFQGPLFDEAYSRGLIKRMRFRTALAHALTAFGFLLALVVAGTVTALAADALDVGASQLYWLPVLAVVFLVVFVVQLRPASLAAVVATRDTAKLTPAGRFVAEA
jgi:hypothetical protein